MKRAVRLLVVALLGILFGGGVMLIVQGGRGLAGSDPPPPSATTRPPPVTVPVDDTTPTGGTAPPTTTSPAAPVVLAWTLGGLPTGFATAVDGLASTGSTTVVRSDLLTLRGAVDSTGRAVGPAPPAGMVIPVDVLAVDPATYPRLLPAADRRTLRQLAPGEAVIGETSARLRDLDVGGQIELGDGTLLTVAATVADPVVAAAEIVVSQVTGATIGVTTERYVLAEAVGAPGTVATQIRSLLDPSVRLRVRQQGETPYLRSSDAVLPQARIKDVFGEFGYVPPVGGREFRQDPTWAAEHIVTAELPIIGEVQCNRGLVPALRGALQELADRNLASLISSYNGCYNPRLIAVGGDISRHAWGAAIDLNFSGNQTGTASIQDRRLVEVMARWGFSSGDGWLQPDPGHFEYIGPPTG